MGRYLPSRNFLYVFGALLAAGVLVGAAYVIATWEDRAPSPARLSLGADPADALTKEFAVQDSDDDGLRDWEENLYGTDPRAADTDGDGTQDGAEIAQKRNPLKAGPNDADSSFAAGGSVTAPQRSENLTEQVSRDIASAYFKLRQEGGLETAPEQEAFVEEFLTTATKRPSVIPHIYAELALSSDEEADARAYGNAVLEIVGGKYKVTYADAYQILSDALAQGKDADKKKLAAIAAAYENAGADLLKASVPPALAETHLSIVNTFFLIAAILPDMGEPLSDPIKALAAFKNYQDALGELTGLFTKTAGYFRTSAILFSSEEKGKLWESFQ